MGKNLTEKDNGEISEIQKAAEGDTETGIEENRVNRMIPSLRILVAVYVLYLAYGLIRDFGQAAEGDRIWIAIAIVVFVAAGGAILFFSVKKLIGKK